MTKTLKELFELYVATSTKNDKNFLSPQHSVQKHGDRNGNGDDVFTGSNVKTAKRAPEHGYDADDDVKTHIKKNSVPKEQGHVREDVEQIDELSKGTLASYIKKAARNIEPNATKSAEHDSKTKNPKAYGMEFGVRSDNEKSWHVKKAESHATKVLNREKGITRAVDKLTKEEVDLSEGKMNLSKVHHVWHSDDSDAKTFAKHYVAAMKGDHRETGPTEKDEKAADDFYNRYDYKHTHSGFAGSGTTIYTDKETGHHWKVDRSPNGKTFYGTDHIINKVDSMKEDVEQLDELSKSTVRSYLKKSDKDLDNTLLTKAGTPKPKISDDDSRRVTKRLKGGAMASKRLYTAESTDVVESAFDRYVAGRTDAAPRKTRLEENLAVVAPKTRESILSMYETLSVENQDVMLDLSESIEGINELVDFVITNGES